jgi:uncharacterized RDD family membrane protein YckC
MIPATMAVATVTPMRRGRAEQARDARFPRLFALILDTIFVGIITSIATAVFGVTEVIWGIPPAAGVGSAFWVGQTTIPLIWATLIWLGYYIVCEGMFSATPGKALVGLRVVSVDDRPLNLWSILVRNTLRLVDVLPGAYLLGGFVTLATRSSQRLGDLAAATTVVYRSDALEPGTTRTSGRPARIALVAAVLAALVFTAAFDYFQRPVLVIQGEYNQHRLMNPEVLTFALGQPTRALDTVTYPITAHTATQSCSGYVTLMWEGLFGWQMQSGQLDCFPS